MSSRYFNYDAEKIGELWDPCPFPGPYYTRWFTASWTDAQWQQGVELFGKWKISSAGPDKTANTNFVTEELFYDATNGTISTGDIIRSQKSGQKN